MVPSARKETSANGTYLIVIAQLHLERMLGVYAHISYYSVVNINTSSVLLIAIKYRSQAFSHTLF